jgi:hypothetical protein
MNLEDCLRYWERRCVRDQPGIFFPTDLWRQAGGLDETLQYAMDLDFIFRTVQRAPVIYIPDLIARFRIHEASKSSSRDQHLAAFREKIRVSSRYQHLVPEYDMRAYQAYATDHLVRWAGTCALACQFGAAFSYLKTSSEVSVLGTLKTVSMQLLQAIARRFVFSG